MNKLLERVGMFLLIPLLLCLTQLKSTDCELLKTIPRVAIGGTLLVGVHFLIKHKTLLTIPLSLNRKKDILTLIVAIVCMLFVVASFVFKNIIFMLVSIGVWGLLISLLFIRNYRYDYFQTLAVITLLPFLLWQINAFYSDNCKDLIFFPFVMMFFLLTVTIYQLVFHYIISSKDV